MTSQRLVKEGVSLIAGSALMAVTILAHPHANSLAGSLNLPPIVLALNIFTHSIGMLSIPFVLGGTWQLTKRLATSAATWAFSTLALGMAAIVCAMTLDGLVNASLITSAKTSASVARQLAALVTYNNVVIQSFSLVYIFAVCLAILSWSTVILRSSRLPAWIGWYGIIMASVTIIAVLRGVVLVDFIGIKIFVGGFISWTLTMGILLRKQTTTGIRTAAAC